MASAAAAAAAAAAAQEDEGAEATAARAERCKIVGNTHHAAGRYSDAVDAYTQAIGLDPSMAVYRYSLSLSALNCSP
jgi:tetratricopeptide (TPR) repeat protein